MKTYYLKSHSYHQMLKWYNTHIKINVVLIKSDEKTLTIRLDNGSELTIKKEDLLTTAPKDSFDVTNKEVLPLYADVVQDLPAYAKFEPRRYNNAQMVTNPFSYPPKKIGYVHYKHKDSATELKIALNSNYTENHKIGNN